MEIRKTDIPKVEKVIKEHLQKSPEHNIICQKVRLAKRIIHSGFFHVEEITVICSWLGFTDTAFRDKTPKQKLNDYLLDENYWLKKWSN